MNQYAIIMKNECGYYSMPIVEATKAQEAREIAKTQYNYLGEIVGCAKLIDKD